LAITVVGDAKGGACKRDEKKSGETTPPLPPSPPPPLASSKSLVLCCWSFNGNFSVQTLNECSRHRKESI